MSIAGERSEPRPEGGGAMRVAAADAWALRAAP
jgi:hypothetical protein